MRPMAYPRRTIAKSHGAVTVTTSSTVPVAAFGGRFGITIKNDSGQSIWIKLQTSGTTVPVATADSGSLKIADGQSFSTTDFSGSIAMITTGGSTTVNVLEL